MPQKIKKLLHESLKNIGTFEKCVLLNYPNYGNIGDHLIGLGTVLYLTEVLKTKITYAASLKNFSASTLERNLGLAPILLQGGGNLGDLWYEHQQFREFIISNYRDRPIIILPQTIYFQNSGCLKQAVKIFNAHPNLTIFTRDKISYNFALKHFHSCQIFLAPDMAFQLVDRPDFKSKPALQNRVLYLKRKDKEINQNLDLELNKIPNLTIEDWTSYQYRWLLEDVVEEWIERRYQITLGQFSSSMIRNMIRAYREGWQRGLARPREYLYRAPWENNHPYRHKFDTHYNAQMYHLSLSLIHSGIYQFSQYKLIITDRLHGHILCTLLGIPHIFLPNAYHKNQAFYETWTSSIPFCKFVDDPSSIQQAIAALNQP